MGQMPTPSHFLATSRARGGGVPYPSIFGLK